MSKINFLFDMLAINQVIEDFDLDTKLQNNGIDLLDNIVINELINEYIWYRKQFNSLCIDELNDNIIIRYYTDNSNNNKVINIVDFILDLLYNNEYLTEYQMLYIMRCINDKLTNISFECIINTLTDGNNIETGVINEIIETEIY